MPGVTTTDRAPRSASRRTSASDDAALAGFDENVLSMTITPLALRLTSWRCSATGSVSSRAQGGGHVELEGDHHAEGAGHVGRMGGAGLDPVPVAGGAHLEVARHRRPARRRRRRGRRGRRHPHHA